MSAFDDAADPELGAACNRLAAWVESLPESFVIDQRSDLGERDLALILRHLHATRLERREQHGAATNPGRVSVPVTAKN